MIFRVGGPDPKSPFTLDPHISDGVKCWCFVFVVVVFVDNYALSSVVKWDTYLSHYVSFESDITPYI